MAEKKIAADKKAEEAVKEVKAEVKSAAEKTGAAVKETAWTVSCRRCYMPRCKRQKRHILSQGLAYRYWRGCCPAGFR